MTPQRRKTDKPIHRRVPYWIAALLAVLALGVIVGQVILNGRGVEATSSTVQSTADVTHRLAELNRAIIREGNRGFVRQCERLNDFAGILRVSVRRGRDRYDDFVKAGTITAAQRTQLRADVAKTLRDLRPVDCAAQVRLKTPPVPRPPVIKAP